MESNTSLKLSSSMSAGVVGVGETRLVVVELAGEKGILL